VSAAPAYLLLEDGARFDGESVGAPVTGRGEVVFNTAMSGYQEAVTDPSYAGQIIVFTYPLIGNYGVARTHMESDRIHARAVIMREGVDREDAAHAEGGWLTWLADCGVPALSGVDTRALVRHIRDKGAMRGGIFAADVAESDARDQVLAELGGRTVMEALEQGDDVKAVWRAVCQAVDVPARER
jgi:carbamoyl-phosphate synthase small subunit